MTYPVLLACALRAAHRQAWIDEVIILIASDDDAIEAVALLGFGCEAFRIQSEAHA